MLLEVLKSLTLICKADRISDTLVKDIKVSLSSNNMMHSQTPHDVDPQSTIVIDSKKVVHKLSLANLPDNV